MDSPPQVSDVFSLSDHLLAERLQFVKEIGFGNWGSVWLCRPKSSSGKVKDLDVAVKLVHRSKTSTTAARVRSLWNEMKIVRSFKNDPHPSIVPFHSFIITPSYALITMAYLPTLIPVEVSESRAKEWFNSLLSGVHFLHSRGVVHNDIKPANILLSRANVPVLVDFGFAEKYDLSSPKAFHSNLTYGTPEYLAPERARGLPHDTRKSDIWSLGITFFEILVGRTPFEYEEGEVFEKKEDLEKYWHRTMRGKWVGKYSMSPSIERFLKRMIVPNADLRCTATEVMGDSYWDVAPATPVHTHRKMASSAVTSSAHSRTPSVFDSFKSAFKEKDKDQSQLRRLDVSLPWSASTSTSRSSLSRPESASRSASRESTSCVAPGKPASQLRTLESPEPTAMRNHRPVAVQTSPATTSSSAIHSRSRSQPRTRTPLEIPTMTRTRKLSTVQASPIAKRGRQFATEIEAEKENHANDRKDPTNACTPRREILMSLNSSPSTRRPLGPRQPSPRVNSISGVKKELTMPLGQLGNTSEKHPLSHLAHLHAPEANYTDTRTPRHQRIASQIPVAVIANQTPVRSTQMSQQNLNQLSGRPPRTRGRAGVLADLTGLARNVDLSAHGVGRPTRQVGEKKDKRKENTKPRPPLHKKNKENDDSLGLRDARKDTCISNGPPGIPSSSPQTPVKEQNTVASIPVVANLSGAPTVTRGSVRDRMMDWERERARLREMDRLADADADAERGSTVLSGTTASSDSSDDDSAVEAEVAAEVAQAKSSIPLEMKSGVKESVNVEEERPSTMQTLTTMSSASDLERSQIEVAKIGVRASAQILLSQNGSISALGLCQSVEKRPSGDSRVHNDSMTDIGLPVEVQRNGESGLTSLKHSVKASIDKGVRLCKSSFGQFTGRTTPVWCHSPEPIDFEQRRSGEEGRFSWENIRSENEVAVDRMNMWIQSVEKVVEETRQNFASTGVTPPAALPLAPTSRTSLQHLVNNPAPTTQNDNISRSSRLPRRLLAANEIFAQSTDPDAPLLPATSRAEDMSTSFSYIHAPESSVPVLPSISVLMQTPRRRRATISARTPTQEKNSLPASGIFDGSPSKHRPKSKSQSNLDRHIKDVAKLELELISPVSSPSPKLSAVLDRSLFVAPPISPRFTEDSTTTSGATRGRSIQFDDLNSSPYLVEPYRVRESDEKFVLTSPDKRQLEGVYDRFLMATSGVKRVGKGYQSSIQNPVDNTMSTPEPIRTGHTRGLFGANKRAMPPPVSSEDAWRRSTSVDELGFITPAAAGHHGTNTSSSRVCKDETRRTFVRRAIKAMVPGRASISRRLSRTIVV